MKKENCQSNSVQETIWIAKNLTKKIKQGTLICLWGNLGSGKTTFVKGLAKGLGIKKTITSPSFLIYKIYSINKKNIKQLVHVDLYRLDKKINLVSLGLDEYLNDPFCICVIEWPEKIKKHLPQKRVDVYFKIIKEDKREITLIHF